MIVFSDVQKILDDVLGNARPGNHGAFWRGKSRDEFVADNVFGYKLINGNDPDTSNLVLALRGQPPFGKDLTPRPPGSVFPRMPKGLPPATVEQIDLIASWIAAGCPEYRTELAGALLTEARLPGNDDYVVFWREMDLVFHPRHANPETKAHVNRMHATAFAPWAMKHLNGGDPAAWDAYASLPETIESFKHVRLHQRRLIDTHLTGRPESVLDSLWKFGGDLLPRDPKSPEYPEHRMNGTDDWCYWLPYLHLSLSQEDRSEIDVALVRGWHMGVIADGMLRTDDERPARIPIPEFEQGDPDLQSKAMAAVNAMNEQALFQRMVERGRVIFEMSA